MKRRKIGLKADMGSETYPEITALKTTLIAHNLRLTIEPEQGHLLAYSYRRIRFSLLLNKLELSISVDDEYGDARNDNQVLLLHLVLAECETYEASDDFLVWASDNGFNASESWVQALYSELGELVPRIREIVGPEIKAISSYDFSLNAGAAAILRKL